MFSNNDQLFKSKLNLLVKAFFDSQLSFLLHKHEVPLYLCMLPFASVVSQCDSWLTQNPVLKNSFYLFTGLLATQWIFVLVFNGLNPKDVAKQYFGDCTLHTKENCPFFEKHANVIQTFWTTDREAEIPYSQYFQQISPSTFSPLNANERLSYFLSHVDQDNDEERLFLDLYELYLSYISNDSLTLERVLGFSPEVAMPEALNSILSLHQDPVLPVLSIATSSLLTSVFIANGLVLASCHPSFLSLFYSSLITSPALLTLLVPEISTQSCVFADSVAAFSYEDKNPYLSFDDFFEACYPHILEKEYLKYDEDRALSSLGGVTVKSITT